MNVRLFNCRSISQEGEPCLKLLVPRHGIGPSLRRFHFTSHRGHEPSHEAVSSTTHPCTRWSVATFIGDWDGIKQSFEADCMVSHR
eukprot:6183275-Prymnesium_polylepis.1